VDSEGGMRGFGWWDLGFGGVWVESGGFLEGVTESLLGAHLVELLGVDVRTSYPYPN
jgi:hypothetical protein